MDTASSTPALTITHTQDGLPVGITHRNTSTIDTFDLDLVVPEVPASGYRAQRVTQAQVQISPAEPDPGKELPVGTLDVTVQMWGQILNSNGTNDHRMLANQRVHGEYVDEARYWLVRTLVRDALNLHDLSEDLVVTPNMQTWQAFQDAAHNFTR